MSNYEFFLEQLLKHNRQWVYVKGSRGDINHVRRQAVLLAKNGITTRIRSWERR